MARKRNTLTIRFPEDLNQFALYAFTREVAVPRSRTSEYFSRSNTIAPLYDCHSSYSNAPIEKPVVRAVPP